MKIWGIAATLGFAVLAFVFGRAVGNDAITAALGADPSRGAYDGAAVAVSLLVGNPVQIVTLGLAARMTGEDLLAYFALDLPRRRDVIIAVAGIVVAPVGEELLFRGFLFRGFVREPRDALPGILAISLIWSLLHVQYDWFGASLVFALGVLLGYVRLYSGSTTLVILLHALLNLESVLETVVVLGW